MRVAYLVTEYPRTSHSFIRREIQAVEAHGVEVLRFSLRPLDAELVTAADGEELARTRVLLGEGPLGLALATARVAACRPLPFARALALAVRIGWRSDRGLLRHLAYLAEAALLERWLRAAGADHLHAHFGTNSAAVALLCRALGGPTFSFTAHGTETFDNPEFLAVEEKIRGSAFTVAVSSYGRAQLWRWARYEDWEKIHVVRCGLDAALLHGRGAPVPAAPRLVCVARLVPLKGHLVLLEAVARLAAEGVPCELVVVGDGPLRGRIEELVRRLGLEDRVRLVGWLGEAEVREAILDARALVLPSFGEGLPVVVMEALALGRPVIATAIAGIPELVETGATGWLVPAGSVDGLVDAMRAALQASPAELERMGRAGPPRIARDHDARIEAGKLIALFRAAIASAGGRARQLRCGDARRPAAGGSTATPAGGGIDPIARASTSSGNGIPKSGLAR